MAKSIKRLRIALRGAVQGVGFRPFVYNLAKDLGLKGFVINNSQGVLIEVEGNEDKLVSFLLRLHREKPVLAHIFSQEVEELNPTGYREFSIKKSSSEGHKEVFILPDVATCDECLKELFDPADRRYMYPFINCTNCGPRFTIIEKLPYDRPNTTMKVFAMCPDCKKEYENPKDRRFHAQPNACPLCGPHVSLYTREGKLVAEHEKAIEILIKALEEGKIVAVKGIGGFHLVCDATNESTVRELRHRKRRQEKPFAVMFRDLEQVLEYASPTELEKALLLSPERPIVLIKKKKELAPSVAPRLNRVGAFLPYSPLHHILMKKLDIPVIATSGNMSDEPIVKDNMEALDKLSAFVDYLLLHNRDIKRRCDDSVVKVIGGVPTPIRRSRGYAPLPVKLPVKLTKRVLAVGGMLKNTFALGFEDIAVLSQHVGDVENLSTLEAFEEAVLDLMELYDFDPQVVVCDLHPRYETARWAREFSERKGIPLIGVQHHYAHVLSCMAENGLSDEVLGIAWDGTGYGEDGTLWGGEFLLSGLESYKRVYHFRAFRLIGGEKAVKEPRRVALSILLELIGEEALELIMNRTEAFKEEEIKPLYQAWKVGINSPLSSSVGRLFDAVSSLLNVKHRTSYEGQSAMILEELYDPDIRDSYPVSLKDGVVDWAELFLSLLEEKDRKIAVSRFINTLARAGLLVAEEVGIDRVCLSGGVMQNGPLVSKLKELLQSRGFKVFVHRKVPPNDGGLCLGQLLCASRL